MVVHLVNPMWNASGGSEQRTAMLYQALARLGPVKVWSEFPIDARLTERIPVEALRGDRHPQEGTIVFVGSYFHVGDWLARANARRLILVGNTIAPDPRLRAHELEQLAGGPVPVEIVYASDAQRARLGAPFGERIEPSPIDLLDFSPDVVSSPREGFTVGRLSRDERSKHHPLDPIVYSELVRAGAAVQVMGGTCLRGTVPEGVLLLPEGELDAADFLRGLHCFYYRTAPELFEAFGRVVVEAMACGLPIVAERRGGYVELLEHGRTALLFDTTQEACELLRSLQGKPALCRMLGEAARERALELYSPAYWQELGDFYFR